MHRSPAESATAILPSVSIVTFAMGTRGLYDWLDGEGRELVRFLPVDQVNEPSLIARNHALVSINGALCETTATIVVTPRAEHH